MATESLSKGLALPIAVPLVVYLDSITSTDSDAASPSSAGISVAVTSAGVSAIGASSVTGASSDTTSAVLKVSWSPNGASSSVNI